jgi:Rha family phage regulatory protein
MTQDLVPYVAPAAQFVQLRDGQLQTTSLTVAEFFGKRHDVVIRAVQGLECSSEFSRHNFVAAEYRDQQRKLRRSYTITRDGFMFLAMGFTGPKAAQIKEAYIAAWNQMEREAKAREGDTTARLQRELINAQKRAVKAERGWRVSLQAQLRAQRMAAPPLKPNADGRSLPLPGMERA